MQYFTIFVDMKAKELHKFIESNGISQASIARKIGVSRTDLNTALRGKRKTKQAMTILHDTEYYLKGLATSMNRINNEEGD